MAENAFRTGGIPKVIGAQNKQLHSRRLIYRGNGLSDYIKLVSFRSETGIGIINKMFDGNAFGIICILNVRSPGDHPIGSNIDKGEIEVIAWYRILIRIIPLQHYFKRFA